MRLEEKYNVLLLSKADQLVDALQYLEYDLDQIEMNISAWIILMNELQEFIDLMARATPDWKFETKEEFEQLYA